MIEKSQISIARSVGITMFVFPEIYLFQKTMTFSEFSLAPPVKLKKLFLMKTNDFNLLKILLHQRSENRDRYENVTSK